MKNGLLFNSFAMKHIRLLGTVIAATALLLSCTQKANEIATSFEEEPGLELTFTAYAGDQPGTRTQRDADNHVIWSPREQISMFYGGGGRFSGNEISSNGGWLFTSDNDYPSDRVTFTGTLTAFTGTVEDAEQLMFYGVYPYNEGNAFDGKYLTTTIPTRQVAAEGTFADGQFVSIGRSSGLSMGFYNLCGGIKFFLQSDDIRRIILRGNRGDEVLAGRVVVDVDEAGHPLIIEPLDPETEIVLTMPDGYTCFLPFVDYFLVTAPVSFKEGFNVTFERMDGSVYTRVIESSLTINRSKFQWSEYPLDYEGPSPYDFPEEHCDIMDPGARAFIENVDYSDDPDYQYSYIKNYSGTDRPQPAYFTWDGTASRVVVSTTTDFADAIEYSVSSSPLEIYNLTPGVRYYYQVLDNGGALVKQACLIPDGPLRMIKSSTRNFRDLGGWVGENGRKIAYGKIYRCAQISSSDASLFKELGITAELDFAKLKGGLTSIYQYYPAVMFLSSGTGKTSEYYRQSIRDVVNWLSHGETVVFHCYAGADRTGTMAFLIESLLGVSESDTSKDFELTTFSSYGSRKRNDTQSYPFKKLISYLRNGQFGSSDATMQQIVTNWATQGENALTLEEIDQLKALLLE